MGFVLSKFSLWWWGREELKVIIVGLDNAGKTTTLYKLLLNEVVVTTPTTGSNVEEFQYKHVHFVMWDIGGQEALRMSWATYYVNTKAVILVVDSTDAERLPIIRKELHSMLEHEHLQSAVVLIYANKQDLKGALSSVELTDALRLTELKKTTQWHIQACCALTGEGLNEGLDWVVTHLGR